MKYAFGLILLIFQIHLSAQTPLFEEIIYEYDDMDYINETKTADIDNNGTPDFILVSHIGHKIFVGKNINFQKPTFTEINSGDDIRQVEVIDFDEDGDIDIVGTAPFDNKSYWWDNDGNGVFTKKTLPFSKYHSILFSDIDGNSVMDIIVSQNDSINIYSNVNGVLTLNKVIYNATSEGNALSMTTFDRNSDGLLEIVVGFGLGGIYIFEQTSPLVFTSNEVMNSVHNTNHIIATDIDNDGDIDILAHSNYYSETTKIKIGRAHV